MKKFNYLIAAAGGQPDFLNSGDFQEKLKTLVNAIGGLFFGVLAIVMVAWGVYIGFKYASAKDAGKAKEAKELLKRLVIGIILMGVAGIVGGVIMGVVHNNLISA